VRLTLGLLVTVVGTMPARAEPAPRGFGEGHLAVGAMRDAPETIAGVLAVGLRGGWWIPESNIGLEVSADAAKLASPDPEGYDATYWDGTFISRLRALGGVRFAGDPSKRRVYFARLAVGVERVAIRTITWSDDNEDRRLVFGTNIAPVLEVSGGFLVGQRDPSVGLELGISRVQHDGSYFEGFRLDYTAIAVEVRLVIGLDL
jgi:hypothetical protein